jgi:hypothetical protein
MSLKLLLTFQKKLDCNNDVFIDCTVGAWPVSKRSYSYTPLRKPNTNDVYVQSKNKSKLIYHFMALLSPCILLLLASCTGTTAPTEPLFVIAGVQDANGANSSILLLQDRILETTDTNAPRFVNIVSQPLAATARAFDLVDEAGTREELVVLSRNVVTNGTTITVSAFLDFFNTRGLLVSDPTTFRVSRSRVDLSTLTFSSSLCPIDVEVTRSGSHAVIFNSPSVCNPIFGSANDSLVVLSLPSRLPETTPASVVSSILSSNAPANPLVRTAVFTGGTSRGGMFLDQSGDSLYYLRQKGAQATELRQLSFSAYTSTDPESSTNVQIISDNIPIRSDEFREMTKVSSNLAILGAGSYVLAPLNVTTGFVPKATNTEDVRGQEARSFVPDATSSLLFILDDNDKLVYHADPTTETNTKTTIRGTVSTINTDSDFLYIAGKDARGNNLMSIVDLLPLVTEGNTNLESLLIEETCTASEKDDPNNTNGLCDLNNPTALTWVKGILLPVTQNP